MKKSVLSLAVMVMASAFVFAQPDIKAKAEKVKHGKHQNKRGADMEQLNLTNAQKAQMKANRADFHKQMKAIESNENQTVKQLREQREALAKEQKAKMENLLTADQKNKLASMKSQAIQEHEERSVQHLDKIKQELNLTDNQVASIKQNQEAAKLKMKGIKDNDKLDRAAKTEQLRAIKEVMKNNMEQILTKEQREKAASKKGDFKHQMKEGKRRMMDKKDRK